MAVHGTFISDWHEKLLNTESNPLLRTYKSIKTSFRLEPYLHLVRELPFRKAIAQIRASSHTLAIEKGRHTRPKTLVQDRLCHICNVIEDETHFIMNCSINEKLRKDLFENFSSVNCEFIRMSESEKIHYIFNNDDRKLLTWFGKFLYKSFQIRNEILFDR